MNKITKIATITSVVFTGAIPFASGAAINPDVKLEGNNLFYIDYTDAQLKEQGCDKGVWQGLVKQYIQGRGLVKKVEERGREQLVIETPKNEFEKCFSGALNKINDLKSKINKVYSFLSGDFSLGDAANDLADKYLEAQCSAINKITTAATGSVTGAINSTINSGMSTVTGGINSAGNAVGINGAANTITKNSNTNPNVLIGGGGTLSDYQGLFGGGNASIIKGLWD